MTVKHRKIAVLRQAPENPQSGEGYRYRDPEHVKDQRWTGRMLRHGPDCPTEDAIRAASGREQWRKMGLPEHRRSPQMTADHYRSPNPNLSPNSNPIPNPKPNRLSAVVCDVQADRMKIAYDAANRRFDDGWRQDLTREKKKENRRHVSEVNKPLRANRLFQHSVHLFEVRALRSPVFPPSRQPCRRKIDGYRQMLIYSTTNQDKRRIRAESRWHIIGWNTSTRFFAFLVVSALPIVHVSVVFSLSHNTVLF